MHRECGRAEVDKLSQAGLHGIAGLYAGKLCKQANRGWLVYGLVLGSLLPDADFFLLGPLYLFSTKLGLMMHRTFTHSLLALVLVWAFFGLTAKRGDTWVAFGKGILAGVALHMSMDVLTWFSGIDFLWPLGFFGVPSTINLWTWFHPPRWLSNLLGAMDYPAFAAFFMVLAHSARKQETNLDFLPRLKVYTTILWVLAAVFTALAFVLGGLFDIAHYALFILIFFPLTLHVVVKMRQTILRFGENL
ncbi:MAG: metal-dependent hydrolase [Bacillota bacterium]